MAWSGSGAVPILDDRALVVVVRPTWNLDVRVVTAGLSVILSISSLSGAGSCLRVGAHLLAHQRVLRVPALLSATRRRLTHSGSIGVIMMTLQVRIVLAPLHLRVR